jgi:hypothetical protein
LKTAGEIASALFDEQFMKKAQGYSNLFDSWAEITAKNEIAAAAAHSRIKEIEKGILLVEMDHPGWKQIIQTKQRELLEDFQKQFPEMEIGGIALILGSREQGVGSGEERDVGGERKGELLEREGEGKPEISLFPTPQSPLPKGFETIKDEEFREKLKSLGESIADREKKGQKS